MRKQRRRCQALGKNADWHRCNVHALSATRAGVLRADVAQDLQARRLVIKLFGDFFADALQRCTIVRAALLGLGEIVDDLDPR